ncbi:helix-turn-helix domain-containing protein [Mangrovicoccus algicola]|nr:XRE family transcriptional regulator [Mangrovicoccus algicola]
MSQAAALARHLRALREARGLTLAALAELSGISRATLSRIETAETSPTAGTLGRMATAFALPVSQLLAPMEDGFQALMRRDAQPVWQDPDHGFTRRSLSPPSGRLRVEMIEGRIAPHRRIAYDAPARPGHEHHLCLLEGALSVTVEELRHDLLPGDCLRYLLFGATVFETGPQAARYVIALA